MISDEVGGSENVNGSRIAMVVIGAMPGSTPTKRADQRAEKAEAEVGRRKRDREARGEIGNQVHAGAPLMVANLDRQSEHHDEQNTAKIASATAKSAFSRSRTS